jgi:type VI secretion system protein
MASERGLFDRLRAPDRGAQRSVQHRTEQVYDSILRHLQRLLNTRQGDSAAAPEYGIPALTDVDYASRAEEMRREIERAIRAYEPRLEGVRVRYVDPDPLDPLRIRFEIDGRLATGEEQVGVRFSTVVDAGGAWRVAG